MTTAESIMKYLNNRKTAATAKTIAKFAKVNPNTARKELGRLLREGLIESTLVKCPIDKTLRKGYIG